MTLALPRGLRPVRLLKETPDSQVVLAETDQGERVVARRSPWIQPTGVRPLLSKLEPLRHAGFQPVLGSTDDWMISHYIEGPTVDTAPLLGLAPVTRGLIQLLSALSYLSTHEINVAYLDPTDVCLQGDGLVLLDLGLVELSQPLRPVRFHNWHVAPELRRGAGAGHRSAIYSVGSLGWWLLTRLEPVPTWGPDDMLEALSHRRPEVPRGWAEVILWMLAPRPDDRPQSGLDAAQSLGAWLATAPHNDTWITTDFGSSPSLEAAVRVEIERLAGPALPDHLAWQPEPTDPVRIPANVPPTVGAYRLLHVLGRGGTAQVYAAMGPYSPEPVALKLLLPMADLDPEQRARFQREMEVSARINHPNVCRILEGGATDVGQLYLVMELLEGEILTDTIRRLSPMPWGLVRPIVRQLIDGVEAIHQAGIIHRDLKPGNIFLTQQGPLKIMDFGIARRLGEQSITKAGMVLGSPGFLSREQLVDTRRVDHRTDLYNIGLLAYQMLSGHLPYEGPKNHDVLMRILSRPSTPLKEYRSDLPGPVEAWVEHLIEKNADDRYQTIAEVLAALPD